MATSTCTYGHNLSSAVSSYASSQTSYYATPLPTSTTFQGGTNDGPGLDPVAAGLAAFGFLVACAALAMSVDWTHNPDGRTRRYRARRMANWLVSGFGYMLQVMSRYNIYSLNTSLVRDALGISVDQMGWVILTFSWTYGVSMIVNALFVDRFSSKSMMLVGLYGTLAANVVYGVLIVIPQVVGSEESTPSTVALANILNATTTTLNATTTLATTNSTLSQSSWEPSNVVLVVGLFVFQVFMGYFQTFGAMCSLSINSRWYSPEEKGTFGGVFGVMILCGYLGSLSTVNLFITVDLWRWTFLFTGALIVVDIVLVHFVVLQNPPQEYMTESTQDSPANPFVVVVSSDDEFTRDLDGLDQSMDSFHVSMVEEDDIDIDGDNEDYFARQALRASDSRDSLLSSVSDTTNGATGGDSPVVALAKNWRLWYTAVALFSFGATRDGFLAWAVDFLRDGLTYEPYPKAVVGQIYPYMFTTGAMFGTLALSLSIDRVPFFKSKRVYLPSILFVMLIPLWIALYFVDGSTTAQFWVVMCLIALLCCALFGLQGYRRIASLELGGDHAVGFAAGVLSSGQNLGAGVGGWLMGLVICNQGYNMWIVALGIFTVVGALVSISRLVVSRIQTFVSARAFLRRAHLQPEHP